MPASEEEYQESEEYGEGEEETAKSGEEYFVEEEYAEEFSIKDLEMFVTLTEYWEKALSGQLSIEDLQQIYASRRKKKVVKRRARRS